MKIYPLKEDIIVKYINTSSSRWVTNTKGVQLIHIPTKMIFECTEFDNARDNYKHALEVLEAFIK